MFQTLARETCALKTYCFALKRHKKWGDRSTVGRWNWQKCARSKTLISHQNRNKQRDRSTFGRWSRLDFFIRCFIGCSIHWFSDSLVHWCTESLNRRVIDALKRCFADSLIHWLTDLLKRWFTESLIQWLIDSLSRWTSHLLLHWLVYSLFVESFTHSIVTSLIQWFLDSVVHWFIHSLVHSLSCARCHVMSLASQKPLKCNFNTSLLLQKLSYQPPIAYNHVLFSKPGDYLVIYGCRSIWNLRYYYPNLWQFSFGTWWLDSSTNTLQSSAFGRFWKHAFTRSTTFVCFNVWWFCYE